MGRMKVIDDKTLAIIAGLLFLAHTFNLAGIVRSVHGG